MMRVTILTGRARWGAALILFASITLGMIACSDRGDEIAGPDPPPPTDPFFPADFQTSYASITDNCRSSQPHLPQIKVWCSPNAENAYRSVIPAFSEGDVLVKVLYEADCSTVKSYVSMRKLATGTSPDYGDWEWQELDADEEIIRSGALSDCRNCHQNCESADWACLEI